MSLPGEGGGQEDLDRMITDLENDAGTQAEESGYSEQNVSPELLAPSKGSETAERTSARPTSKPSGSQDWEKRYKSIRPEYDRTRSKMSVLEGIIKNPKFHALAETNPEIREALAKAGYELASEQERQDEGEGEVSPERLEIETLRHEMILDRQLNGLSKSLGRDLQRQELMEILDIKKHIGGLSVEQAWQLTPSYQKHLKTAEDKRFEDFKKKASVNRPRPTAPIMPGQTLDMKKSVTEMNDAERQAKIADILSRNE